MMSLNVRGVDDEVMAAFRVAAAQEGKTLREWVLDTLTSACGRCVSVVGASAPVPVVEVATRPDHDPKDCRLYGCGRCRAAGVRDAHRGLGG